MEAIQGLCHPLSSHLQVLWPGIQPLEQKTSPGVTRLAPPRSTQSPQDKATQRGVPQYFVAPCTALDTQYSAYSPCSLVQSFKQVPIHPLGDSPALFSTQSLPHSFPHRPHMGPQSPPSSHCPYASLPHSALHTPLQSYILPYSPKFTTVPL